MIARWLRSEWRWLLVGVVAGVLLVVIWRFGPDAVDALAEA